MDRNQLLTEHNATNKEEVIPYISTFNPRNPEMFTEIHSDINILRRDEYMKNAFSKYRFIKSKRQPPNLKRLLTKAKFSETHHTVKVISCRRPNCVLCTHLQGQNYTSRN